MAAPLEDTGRPRRLPSCSAHRFKRRSARATRHVSTSSHPPRQPLSKIDQAPAPASTPKTLRDLQSDLARHRRQIPRMHLGPSAGFILPTQDTAGSAHVRLSARGLCANCHSFSWIVVVVAPDPESIALGDFDDVYGVRQKIPDVSAHWFPESSGQTVHEAISLPSALGAAFVPAERPFALRNVLGARCDRSFTRARCAGRRKLP